MNDPTRPDPSLHLDATRSEALSHPQRSRLGRGRREFQRRGRLRGREGRRGRSVLLLGWCLWLLGAWAVLWWEGGWTLPALRVMVFSSVVGLMGVWPAVRLSEASSPVTAGRLRKRHAVGSGSAVNPGDSGSVGGTGTSGGGGGGGDVDDVSVGDWARSCGGVLLDWLCLNLIFQAVLWPLQISAGWSWAQAWWLNAAVAGWSLLTALLIAWGRGTDRPGWRQLAMWACVGVVVLEPALLWIGWQRDAVGPPTMRISPIQTLWTLTTPGATPAGTPGPPLGNIPGNIPGTPGNPGSIPASDTAALPPVGFRGLSPASSLAATLVLSIWFAALAGWGVLWTLLAARALTERKTSEA